MMHSLASIVGELDKKHIFVPPLIYAHNSYEQTGRPVIALGPRGRPVLRGRISYQRGNVLRPDLTCLQQTLTSKLLRLLNAGSDRLYKSCHYTLKHGVYGVQQVARPKL